MPTPTNITIKPSVALAVCVSGSLFCCLPTPSATSLLLILQQQQRSQGAATANKALLGDHLDRFQTNHWVRK